MVWQTHCIFVQSYFNTNLCTMLEQPNTVMHNKKTKPYGLFQKGQMVRQLSVVKDKQGLAMQQVIIQRIYRAFRIHTTN